MCYLFKWFFFYFIFMGLTNSAPESKDRRGMYIVRGNFLGGFGDFQKMERKMSQGSQGI